MRKRYFGSWISLQFVVSGFLDRKSTIVGAWVGHRHLLLCVLGTRREPKRACWFTSLRSPSGICRRKWMHWDICCNGDYECLYSSSGYSVHQCSMSSPCLIFLAMVSWYMSYLRPEKLCKRRKRLNGNNAGSWLLASNRNMQRFLQRQKPQAAMNQMKKDEERRRGSYEPKVSSLLSR